MNCACVNPQPIEVIGLCDPASISFTTNWPYWDRNFTEISVADVVTIPPQKPDIETLDKVIIKTKIISKRLIETPVSGPNPEGVHLTGFKLIVEGIIFKKIIYTADVASQSVHAAHFEIPFSAFIVINRDLVASMIAADELDKGFCVDVCVEDVFVKAFGPRQIFQNVTLFLRATEAPTPVC